MEFYNWIVVLLGISFINVFGSVYVATRSELNSFQKSSASHNHLANPCYRSNWAIRISSFAKRITWSIYRIWWWGKSKSKKSKRLVNETSHKSLGNGL